MVAKAKVLTPAEVVTAKEDIRRLRTARDLVSKAFGPLENLEDGETGEAGARYLELFLDYIDARRGEKVEAINLAATGKVDRNRAVPEGWKNASR